MLEGACLNSSSVSYIPGVTGDMREHILGVDAGSAGSVALLAQVLTRHQGDPRASSLRVIIIGVL